MSDDDIKKINADLHRAPDTDPFNNAHRAERLRQFTKDAGVYRDQIQRTVRDFNRRIEDRVAFQAPAIPVQPEPKPTPPPEIKAETVTIAPGSLTLGAPLTPAGDSGPGGQPTGGFLAALSISGTRGTSTINGTTPVVDV